jgi:Flp pilus assembly pilin Flp
MFARVLRFVENQNDRGATAVEYAIMASLIAAVIAVTVFLVGQSVLGLFSSLPASAFGG